MNLTWPFNHYDEHGQLTLNAFWAPPYFPQIELHGLRITSEIIQAQRSNWDCVLPELKKLEEKSLIEVDVATAEAKVTSPIHTPHTAREASSALNTAREPSSNDGATREEAVRRLVERVLRE